MAANVPIDPDRLDAALRRIAAKVTLTIFNDPMPSARLAEAVRLIAQVAADARAGRLSQEAAK